MAFDGIKQSADRIELLLGATLEAHRATIATAHGVTLDTLASVIRSQQVEYAYPHAEIAPVSGPLTVTGDSVYAALTRWVMVAERDPDAAVLAAKVEAWLTALTRTFGSYESPDGSWSTTIMSVDESPPYQQDETWVAVVGVQVVMTMGSDL